MLFLNIRQIELIHRILKYEYIQSDEIVNYFMISSRTLQSDISLINYEFEKNEYGLCITLHRKKGYFIESLLKDDRSIEQLKNQCIEYLDNSILRELGSQPRVCFILRKLLVEKNFLKSEDFLDELHISNATLTNDLKLTRNLLDTYGIDINSVPYYGMQLVGESLRIRSCLLDVCDIYNFQDKTSIFPENAYEQYHFNKQDMLITRKKLILILKNSHVLITDQGLQLLLINLLLVKSSYANKLQFQFKEHNYFDEITNFSHLIAQEFEIEDMNEIHYICLIIILHLDDISIKSPISNPEYLNYISDQIEIIRSSIQTRYNLDIGSYPTVLKTLETFIIKSTLRKEYKIIEKCVPSRFKDIVSQIPASRSLAINILRVIYPNGVIDTYQFLELSIILFNAIFTIPNSYADMRIAYVNKISRFASQSVSYRNALTRYNIEIDYLSSYDLETTDLTKYDGIITSGTTQLDKKDCPVIMLEFDYFDTNRNSSELWEKLIMKLRVDELVLPKLSRVEKRVLHSRNNDIIQEITKHLNQAGIDQDHLLLQISDGLYTSQILNNNSAQMFCVYSLKELNNTVFQFILENETLINGSLVDEISVIVLSPDNNILTIKQADSAIRRLYQQTLTNRT